MPTTLPAVLFLLSCTPKPAPVVAEVAPPPPPPAPPAWAADLLSSMDPKVDACSDFYAYACGGWIAATPLPADKPRWGRSFSVINDRNLDTLKGIVEEAAKNPGGRDADWQKMGDTYGSCMDEGAVDAAGVTPLAPLFASIEKLKDLKGFMRLAGELQGVGVDAVVRVDVEGDFKNPDLNVLYIGQSGLGLPDRDYYFPTDDKGKALLADYQAHMGRMLVLSGVPEADAVKAAADVVAFETKLAEASIPKAELRDPQKSYNRVDRAGLLKLTPKLDWAGWLEAVGAGKASEISVDRPDTYKKFEAVLLGTKVATLKQYLRFHTISTLAPNLAKPVFEEDFGFYQVKVVGRKEAEPRWKRCLAVVNGSVGEVAGRYYVEKAFPGESKAVADSMLGDIQAAFVSGLPKLAWMDDATRERAKEKAAKISRKIGYPDAWRDYAAVKTDRKSFFKTSLATSRFETARQFAKVGKPVDRAEWLMSPPTVNAYNEGQKNEIVFPAGILQPPFFDQNATDAVNFGSMGMVVGHEITHGFDDEGRQFDADGNLKDWWSEASGKDFVKRAECVKKQFDGYTAVEDLKVKGDLTLGENVADLGGLKLAHSAMIEWYTKQANAPAESFRFDRSQQFFLGFAQSWCTKVRPQMAKMRVATDPHAPPFWRVNGPLGNTEAFKAAFQCSEGSKMVRVGADRCSVW